MHGFIHRVEGILSSRGINENSLVALISETELQIKNMRINATITTCQSAHILSCTSLIHPNAIDIPKNNSYKSKHEIGACLEKSSNIKQLSQNAILHPILTKGINIFSNGKDMIPMNIPKNWKYSYCGIKDGDWSNSCNNLKSWVNSIKSVDVIPLCFNLIHCTPNYKCQYFQMNENDKAYQQISKRQTCCHQLWRVELKWNNDSKKSCKKQWTQ